MNSGIHIAPYYVYGISNTFIMSMELVIPQNKHCRMILQNQHTMTFQILPHYVHL